MSPNKIILQLGVLAFCVTVVFLGIQNVSLVETVTRSFIVFVGVVLTVAMALIASSMFVLKRGPHTDQPVTKEKRPAQREAGAAKP
jgi:purine-cytosine permease-like protein